MPIYYAIEPELNLLYYTGSGESSADELLRVERVAFADPLRKPGMAILFDGRPLIDFRIEVGDFGKLIRLNRQLAEQHYELEKTAIVTRSSGASSLVNTLTTLAMDLPIKVCVFYIIPDALSWLGLPAEAMQRVEALNARLLHQHQEGRLPAA